MLKKSYVMLLMCFLIGCTSQDDEASFKYVEEGTVWGDGIVSEDPPGAGDYEDEEPEEDEDALAPDREVGDDDEEPDSDAERVEVASESEMVMSPNRAVMSSRPSSFVSSPRTVSGSTSST